MRLVDLREAGPTRTCVDDELHPFPSGLDGCVRHRFAQPKVIDHDVQRLDAIACNAPMLG